MALLRNIVITLIISVCIVPLKTAACSCLYMGKFIDYTGGRGIIKARVKQYGAKLSHSETLYEHMTVEVMDVIDGKYKRNEIIFLGDPGNLCRAYVDSDRFPIGSKHLISISSSKHIQALGGCGESAVAINDGKVWGGEIVNGKYEKYSIELDEYLELLRVQRAKTQ